VRTCMKSCVIFGCLTLAAFFAAGAFARLNSIPRLEMSPELHVGELAHDQELKLAVGFRNGGTGILHVDPPIPGCNCTQARLERQDYAPGETGTFEFTLRPVQPPGTEYAQSVIVPTNDPKQPRAELIVRGKMADRLISWPSVIRDADVKVGEGWERRCVIRCTDSRSSFELQSVECDLPGSEAFVVSGPDRNSSPMVIVRQSFTRRTGVQLGYVLVRTNHEKYRELKIPVEIVVCSRMTLNPASVLIQAETISESRVIQVTTSSPVELEQDVASHPEWSVKLYPDETRCRWSIHITRAGDRGIPRLERGELALKVSGLEHEDRLSIPFTLVPAAKLAAVDQH
jgi:hypothetical protein